MEKCNFVNSIEDVVLISTFNRPNVLYSQIISYLENMLLFCSGYRSTEEFCNSKMPEEMYKLRKIYFCIVDDSSNKYKSKYEKEIERINTWIKKNNLENCVFVDYWSKNKQIDLIKKVGNGVNLTEIHLKSMFSDVGGRSFGGIRGICNIIRIIGIHIAISSEKNPTLHFLDSDIYPFVLWKKNDYLKMSHLYYFFGHKAWMLENRHIKITGSYYTVDSPSPIIDLYEAINFIEKYLEGFQNSNIDSHKDWTEFSSKFEWIGQKIIFENVSFPNSEINLYISSNGTFRSQLSTVVKLIEILFKGNNRLVFNTANFSKKSKWHGKRDNFPNGCISMKLKEALELKPYPLFGNQELILFPYEYANTGKLFWGDFDVAHIKELSGRLSLFNDLELRDKKYRPKHDFMQLFEISQYLEKNMGIKFSSGIKLPRRRFKDDVLKFAVYGDSVISKMKNIIGNIIIICKNVESLDQDNILTIRRYMEKIEKRLPYVENQYNFSKANYISSQNLKLLNSWFEIFPDWNKFITGILKYNK